MKIVQTKTQKKQSKKKETVKKNFKTLYIFFHFLCLYFDETKFIDLFSKQGQLKTYILRHQKNHACTNFSFWYFAISDHSQGLFAYKF
jgi:hypothetical protein